MTRLGESNFGQFSRNGKSWRGVRGVHGAAEPQPNARPRARRRARARMRHGKLLQQEERCQLTCDGIRLRNGFTASL